MKWRRNIVVLVLIVVITFTASGDYLSTSFGNYRTAREADTSGAPTWPVNPDFKNDTFTFARVQYVADPIRYGSGHTAPEDRFLIDFPLSDLDLSYRLHQMTSLNV